MTTKPDFRSVMELRKAYIPAQRGVVTDAEAELIRTVLELPERTDIELQNIRDVSVMVYGQAAQGKTGSGAIGDMDAMSAVCAVIDREKFRRGLPV